MTASPSSTDSATSIPLTLTDRVDFTLDFGVVPVVSVGDYVWDVEVYNPSDTTEVYGVVRGTICARPEVTYVVP